MWPCSLCIFVDLVKCKKRQALVVADPKFPGRGRGPTRTPENWMKLKTDWTGGRVPHAPSPSPWIRQWLVFVDCFLRESIIAHRKTPALPRSSLHSRGRWRCSDRSRRSRRCPGLRCRSHRSYTGPSGTPTLSTKRMESNFNDQFST